MMLPTINACDLETCSYNWRVITHIRGCSSSNVVVDRRRLCLRALLGWPSLEQPPPPHWWVQRSLTIMQWRIHVAEEIPNYIIR